MTKLEAQSIYTAASQRSQTLHIRGAAEKWPTWNRWQDHSSQSFVSKNDRVEMVGDEHTPGQACGVAVFRSAQVLHQLVTQAFPRQKWSLDVYWLNWNMWGGQETTTERQGGLGPAEQLHHSLPASSLRSSWWQGLPSQTCTSCRELGLISV